MNRNGFEGLPKTAVRTAEYDENSQALLRDAENKIRILKDFLITGDFAHDYNYFLEITNRNVNYKKATGENKENLIKNLEGILSSLLEIKEEKINDINASKSSKMFYEELPEAEINAINRLIDSYK